MTLTRNELQAAARKRHQALRRKQRDPRFKKAQCFRAGVEGSISFLKRALGLERCLDRGWTRFVSAIARAVFVHNLRVLAEAFG